MAYTSARMVPAKIPARTVCRIRSRFSVMPKEPSVVAMTNPEVQGGDGVHGLVALGKALQEGGNIIGRLGRGHVHLSPEQKANEQGTPAAPADWGVRKWPMRFTSFPGVMHSHRATRKNASEYTSIHTVVLVPSGNRGPPPSQREQRRHGGCQDRARWRDRSAG